MSTTTGRLAESAAAEYLESLGYKILQQNWRTRYCEIDLVALANRKSGAKIKPAVYFIEVKYRSTENQGSGLDYITKKKVEQMAFASRFWLKHYNWSGEIQLMGIEVNYDLSIGQIIKIDL